MNISIRSSDLNELVNKPELIRQAGTATLVSGTGTFIAPISMLREIAGAPDAVQQLEDIVEALAEQEQLYAMAILGAAVTGIANTLWYIPVPEGQHGPRIKVAIDPPYAKRPGGTEATVPFDEGKPASGPITPALERQVRQQDRAARLLEPEDHDRRVRRTTAPDQGVIHNHAKGSQ